MLLSEKISQLVDKKVWLAPLAGYTDQGFRRVCKSWGADVLVSEMVSSDGLIRDSRKTIQYIEFTPFERPYGIQLFGSDPLIMAKAAEYCLEFNPDFIDVNMGCPVKKVVKRFAGSALMKSPEKAGKIVSEIKRAISDTTPLSVKFRSGWDSNSLNYIDFGLLMQDSGADFLCLHARTQTQMFSGKADWQHIANLKQVLDIPLIGNGDIISSESAKQMFNQTGCDSIMIGRGVLGKPWLFHQVKSHMNGYTYSKLTLNEIKDTLLLHIGFSLEHKPEHVVVREMRSQICYYSKGMKGGAEFRKAVNSTKDINELISLVETEFNREMIDFEDEAGTIQERVTGY